MHGCGPWVWSLCVHPHLSPCLTQNLSVVHNCIQRASWPVASRGSPVSTSRLSLEALGLQIGTTGSIFIWVQSLLGDSKLSPHSCAARVLPSDLSPQPLTHLFGVFLKAFGYFDAWIYMPWHTLAVVCSLLQPCGFQELGSGAGLSHKHSCLTQSSWPDLDFFFKGYQPCHKLSSGMQEGAFIIGRGWASIFYNRVWLSHTCMRTSMVLSRALHILGHTMLLTHHLPLYQAPQKPTLPNTARINHFHQPSLPLGLNHQQYPLKCPLRHFTS